MTSITIYLNTTTMKGVFDSVDSENYKAFSFIAANDEAHVYVYTTSNEVKRKLALEKDTVVVLKSFDEGMIWYICNFISQHIIIITFMTMLGRVDYDVGESLQVY